MLKCHRHEATALHVRAQLAWHLLKDLLVEVSLGNAIVEGAELNDVASDGLPTRVGKDSIVAIQLLHLGEVSVADANNDDGDGHLG